MIDKIKKPLKKAIAILAMRYPEPTKEHTLLPNTHLLIDIRDKFFEHQVSNEMLFRAIWRMFIVEYEHDPYYRYRIDWVIEEICKSGWGAKPTKPPDKCWKE